MDIADVAKRVKDIEQGKWDDEVAHSDEDSLYRDLLSAIADGTCTDPAACAALALTTQELEFARWCA